MGFKVEFFVQGHGWLDGRKVHGGAGTFASYQEALDFCVSLIERCRSSSALPYGSRSGDVVGFRVIESDEPAEMKNIERPSLRFEDVKHLYFKRGNTYFLYKSWSWPD